MNEPWCFTILLLEGLRLMRPEKAWRPIITIDVDKHHSHETTLGVDGQNINQKEVFKFHDATLSTRLEVKVWYLSQSKKKRRRVLVASADHCLGELLKKRDLDSRIEIRLQCRSAVKPSQSSKGRPQKGALLCVRLRPPPIEKLQPEDDLSLCPDDESCSPSNLFSPSPSFLDFLTVSEDSESVATIDSGRHPPNLPISDLGIRRRIRGYCISTDDEMYDAEWRSDVAKDRYEDNSLTCVCDDESDPQFSPLVIHPYAKDIVSLSSLAEKIAASNIPLPLYSEKIKVPPDFSKGQKLLASCTLYGDLSLARTDDHFEPLFRRFQQEWSQNGGLLCALAAIDTAVFTLSPDSMFLVNDYAKNAIALSSIASGVGLACDTWFLLRYTWIDVQTFSSRARDIYDGYLFFSISARVPTLCTCLSAISLTGFLALVAFETWPEAVLVLCFFIGIVMSLQYLVYGVHIAARTLASGGRAGRDHIRQIFDKSNPYPNEKNISE